MPLTVSALAEPWVATSSVIAPVAVVVPAVTVGASSVPVTVMVRVAVLETRRSVSLTV